jgi:Flp pilus assembly protein TadG
MNGHTTMAKSLFRFFQGSRRNRFSRAQSAVEFAIIAPIALSMMLVGVQYALIGQAAVAVSQGASAIARYAASNPGGLGTNNGTVSYSSLPPAVQQLLSPSIATNGGSDLTITINSFTGSGASETGSPVAASDKVVINLSYVTTSKLAVPNPFRSLPPIFGGITFPGTVASSDSQMYE